MPLALEVLPPSMSGSPSPLTGDWARGLVMSRRDAGAGSVQVEVGSADEALLVDRAVVRVVDSTPVPGLWGTSDGDTWGTSDGDSWATGEDVPGDALAGLWVVERAADTWASQSEEQGETVSVAGRDALSCWLSGSRLQQPGGVDRRFFPSSRGFGFWSLDFDHDGWIAVTEIKQQDDPADPYSKAPKGWVGEAGHAQWVWSRARDLTPPGPIQPVGRIPIVQTVTVSTERDVVIDFAADDRVRVFWDGAEVSSTTEEFLWQDRKRISLGVVEAGTHLLAFECENVPRDNVSTNGAAVIWAVLGLGSGGDTVEDVFAVSDDSAVCLDYPDPWPGMTVGDVLAILFTEAKARGTIPASVTWDTTAATETIVDSVWQIGASTLWGIVSELAGWAIDIRLDLDTLEIVVTDYGEMQASTGLTLSRGVNVIEGRRDRDTVRANGLLVRYGSGEWCRVELSGSIVAHGRVDGYLEIGSADSEDQAVREASGWLAEFGWPGRTWTVEVDPVLTPEVRDLRPHDLVTVVRAGVPSVLVVERVVVDEIAPASDGQVGGSQRWVLHLEVAA